MWRLQMLCRKHIHIFLKTILVVWVILIIASYWMGTLWLLIDNFSMFQNCFLRQLFLMALLWTTHYYATRGDFPVHSGPHVYSFICILNAPYLSRDNTPLYPECVMKLSELILQMQIKSRNYSTFQQTTKYTGILKLVRTLKIKVAGFTMGDFSQTTQLLQSH